MVRRQASIALLAFAFAASCRVAATPAVFSETHTFPAAPGKLVRLDTRSLDVEVHVTQQDAITVAVTLDARSSSSAAARRWVEHNTPSYDDSAASLDVHVPSQHHGLFLVGFLRTVGKITVGLPPTCRLEVNTSSGDVRLDGGAPLSGTVRVGSSSGDVTVHGGAKELSVTTTSGDVRVDAEGLTLAQVETSSGDVQLLKGADRALVDTSSGEVRLDELRGELSAHTSSGDVRAAWRSLPGAGSVKVRTSSGDVTLRLPGQVTPSGTLDSSSGSIVSDFPGSWTRRQRTFAFDAAHGGVDVEVTTSSGDITLHKG